MKFVHNVVFDFETALKNTKLAMLERLELPLSFSPSQLWIVEFGGSKFSPDNFSGILQKPKCHLYL